MKAKDVLFIGILSVPVLLADAPAGAACNTVADLAPAKVSYLEGEPVELVLTLTNKGTQAVHFAVAYPFFDWVGQGVRLWSTTGVNPSTRRDGHDEKAPTIAIEPGRNWSVKIYLQRYVGELYRGAGRFEYSINITCLNEGLHPDGAAVGMGDIRVDIRAGRSEDLSRAITEYARGLFGSDHWSRRSALEALSLTTSPDALQYVRGIMDAGDSEIAFSMLERFRGNSRAVSILGDAAQNARLRLAIEALGVLQRWRSPLSDADLRRILSRDLPEVRLAALRYAEVLGNPAYASVVSSCASDPDEQVAGEAKRVLRALGGTK